MNNLKKTLLLPALSVVMLGGGALASYAGLASAQTPATTVAPDTSTTAADTSSATDTSVTAATQTTSTTSATPPQRDPSRGGHTANGITETLLTGDSATKATAAALAAVPGGTVERAETDAEGAAFEVHMTKSDGSHVTIKLDANYAVTGTETGMGGHGGPNGQ